MDSKESPQSKNINNMKKHYQERLRCATCAGEDFEFNEDKSYVKCTTCGREYWGGYDELLQYNQDVQDGLMNQLEKDVEKKLKADLQKAFKGIKGIKINIK